MVQLERLEGRRLLAMSALPVGGDFWGRFSSPILAERPEVAGRYAYFRVGSGSGESSQVYRTDGTSIGTRVVQRRTDPGDWYLHLAALGDRMTYVQGTKLYITSGTTSSTQQLYDFQSVVLTRGIWWTQSAGDRVYLALSNPATQRDELWVTDGTASGTVPVYAQFLYGSLTPQTTGGFGTLAGGAVKNRVSSGSTLYFLAGDPSLPVATDQVLWKSNGTPAGTGRVLDSGGYSYLATSPVVGPGGAVFFGGESLYRVNPSTGLIAYFSTSFSLSSVDNLTLGPGGRVLFSASAIGAGSQLFATDGTAAGTVRLLTSTGTGITAPADFVYRDGLLYFTALQGTKDREVYVTDGTSAGTVRLTDDAPSTVTYAPKLLGAVSGNLFYDAGTYGGVTSINGASRVSTRLNLTASTSAVALGNRMLLSATQADVTAMFSSDGTVAGTTLVRQSRTSLPPTDAIKRAGSRSVYFANGQLRRMDDPATGAFTVLGNFPSNNGYFRSFGFFREFDTELYFTSSPLAATADLWRTDGTVAGTQMVATGVKVDDLVKPAFMNGDALLAGTIGTQSGVFRIGGSTLGVTPVRAYPSAPNGGTWSVRMSVGQTVVLVELFVSAGSPPTTQFDRWVTDGTAAGTVARTELGNFGVAPFGGRWYYFSSGSLWSLPDDLSGTPALVADAAALGSPTSTTNIVAASDGVYFNAGVTGGHRLMRVNGPTSADVTIVGRSSSSTISSFTYRGTYNGRVVAMMGQSGGTAYAGNSAGLVSFDAAANPTVLVRSGDLAWSILSTMPVFQSGGGFTFGARSNDGGSSNDYEPWFSDGTLAGTRRLRDIKPGTTASFPGFGSSGPDGAFFLATLDGNAFTGRFDAYRVVADSVAPGVGTASMTVDRTTALRISFSERLDVNSIKPTDVAFVRISDGVSFPGVAVAIDPDRTRATFAPDSPLPDGEYRVEVAAGAVSDEVGNPIGATTLTDATFFVMAGDANRDRTVSFDDLLILAANYNTAGKVFPQGDFNYDGSVNFDDLLILAARYNTSTQGVVAPPPPANGSATGDDGDETSPSDVLD